jgi:hypothetical protein
MKQEFKNSRIQRFKNSTIQEFKDSKAVREFPPINTETQSTRRFVALGNEVPSLWPLFFHLSYRARHGENTAFRRILLCVLGVSVFKHSLKDSKIQEFKDSKAIRELREFPPIIRVHSCNSWTNSLKDSKGCGSDATAMALHTPYPLSRGERGAGIPTLTTMTCQLLPSFHPFTGAGFFTSYPQKRMVRRSLPLLRGGRGCVMPDAEQDDCEQETDDSKTHTNDKYLIYNVTG